MSKKRKGQIFRKPRGFIISAIGIILLSLFGLFSISQADQLDKEKVLAKPQQTQAGTQTKPQTKPQEENPSKTQPASEVTKTVYLTFDDGPSANTPVILNILKEQGVRATFFVVGTEYPQYMKTIVDQGNAIGLHTYSHKYSQIYKSSEAFFQDLDKIAAVVKRETGQETTLLRFPGGSSNTVSKKYSKGIMTRLTREAEHRGYRYFDWNCSSGDASGNGIPADTLLHNVKAGVAEKKEVTILMHDSSTKKTTVEALPEIIRYLKSQNYQFGTLDTASATFHHKVNN